MQQERKLQNKTTGMFGGPRGTFGQNLQGNGAATSGTTYGGQGLGWYWQGYPSVIGGMTNYDPRTLQPGSNLSALQNPQAGSEIVAMEAGMADGIQPGLSVGGTAAY